MSIAITFHHTAGSLGAIGSLVGGVGRTASGVALGVLAGAVSVSALRRRDLHWSWAAVALLAAVSLRSILADLASVCVTAALYATMRGRRLHMEDLDAGADLADRARRRRTPADLARQVVGGAALRRCRSRGPRGWYRSEELILGQGRRGELVSIPFGGSRGGTHTLLVGATGSGKTVTQTCMAVRSIESGTGAIVLDPKGDRDMRAAVARAARSAGRNFIEWTPRGPCAYNPFSRGSDSEIADKVLAAERFTEPHYQRQAQRMLGHVVRSLRAAGSAIDLGTIAQSLDPAELESLARSAAGQDGRATEAYLDSLTARQVSDLSGVRDRLAILVESDVGGWLDAHGGTTRCLDLLDAIRSRDVVYFDLDADSRPLLTQMLGAAIVQDLQTAVAALQGRPVPTVVVIDEFSALAAESVVGLFARARSAGLSLVLSTQELSDLRLSGREALLERVLGNLTVVLSHRQVVPSSAELIAGLAGSVGAWRTSRHGDGRVSRTRVSEHALGAETLMTLAVGWVAAIVLSDSRDARLARVLPLERAK